MDTEATPEGAIRVGILGMIKALYMMNVTAVLEIVF